MQFHTQPASPKVATPLRCKLQKKLPSVTVPLVTALVSYVWVYQLFSIATCYFQRVLTVERSLFGLELATLERCKGPNLPRKIAANVFWCIYTKRKYTYATVKFSVNSTSQIGLVNTEIHKYDLCKRSKIFGLYH